MTLVVARSFLYHVEALVSIIMIWVLCGTLVATPADWGIFYYSVLMHLLPGLAVFAHLHHTPDSMKDWRNIVHYLAGDLWQGQQPILAPPSDLTRGPVKGMWFCLIGAPVLFYLAWQLVYFLIVQVSQPKPGSG